MIVSPCVLNPPDSRIVEAFNASRWFEAAARLIFVSKVKKCLAQDDMVLYCKLFQREIMKLGNLSGQISQSHSH